MIDHEQKFIDIHLFLNHAKKVAEDMNRLFGWSVSVNYDEITEVKNVSRETKDGETND